MPYCPHCRYEYRDDVTHCPDCGAALHAGTPPEEALPLYDDSEHEPVVLCRVADTSEAEIICGVLREERIPYFLQTTGPITARLTLVTDGQAPDDYTIIHVPQGRLAEAQQVLTALRSAPFVWPAGLEPEDQSP